MGSLQEDHFSDLPGGEIVIRGLTDLRAGITSPESLLVLIASPRLRNLGISVPFQNPAQPPHEHQLYSLLEQTMGAGAYSYYNSLIRRMVSFAHALEHR